MSSSSLGTLRSPCGPPLRRRRPRRRRRFRPRPRAPPFWPLLESRSADGPPASPPALGESDEDASEVVASTFGAWFCSASGDSGTSLPKVHGLGRRASKAHLHPSGGDSRNRLAPFLGASSQRADGPRRRRRQRCVSRDDRNVGRNTRRIKVAVDEAPSARRVPGPPSVPLERSASPDDPPVEAPDQPSGRCPLGRKGCPRDGTAPHVACPAPQRLFLYALPAVTRSRELRHGLCNNRGRIHTKEDTVRSPARSALILATLLSLGASGAQAQASVSFTLAAGPLFTGVSFGVGGPIHDHASVYYGSSFGYANPHYSGFGTYSSYGVYSSRTHYSASCYDAYWYAYDHCFVTASYHPGYAWDYGYWGPRWSHNRWQRTRYTFVADPYYDPWGPYWAYDPWGSYWDGYWDGYVSGSHWNSHWGHGYYPTRHRYARGYYVTRASSAPIAAAYYAGNARYKENPTRRSSVATGRRAQPRSGAQPAVAAPRASVASATARRGADDARRRGVASVNRRAPRAGASATGSAPRTARPDATARRGAAGSAAPNRSATGRAGRVPTVGRRPVAAARTTRGSPISRPSARSTRTTRGSNAVSGSRQTGGARGSDARRAQPEAGTSRQAAPARARTGSKPTRATNRPSAASRPSTRSAPQRATTRSAPSAGASGRGQARSRTPSLNRRPAATRSSPRATSRAPRARATTPRAAPSRASGRGTPATRSAPSRGSSARPAPIRTPRTRSAPARTPQTRSAPTRAPQARSAPARSGRSAPARGRGSTRRGN